MSQDEQQAEIKRAMVVVAHPDDAEFGAAGTIAKWASEGIEVYYVLCTDGSKGSSNPNVAAEDLIRMRRQEQIEAAKVLGAKEVEFLDYPDAYLEHTLELRRDITRMIRKYRPDRVICQAPYRSFGNNAYINHPDHLAAGDATLAAIYPTARDRLTFPELLADGYEPHKVREVYVMGGDGADTWIDITDTVDKKVASLRKHASQVGDSPEFAERIKERAARVAEGHGMKYAEAFKVFRLG